MTEKAEIKKQLRVVAQNLRELQDACERAEDLISGPQRDAIEAFNRLVVLLNDGEAASNG